MSIEPTFGKEAISWVDKVTGNNTSNKVSNMRDKFIQENSILRQKNKNLSLELDKIRYKVIVYKTDHDAMQTRLRHVLGESLPMTDNIIQVDQYDYINLCRDNETFKEKLSRVQKSYSKLKKENKELKAQLM